MNLDEIKIEFKKIKPNKAHAAITTNETIFTQIFCLKRKTINDAKQTMIKFTIPEAKPRMCKTKTKQINTTPNKNLCKFLLLTIIK